MYDGISMDTCKVNTNNTYTYTAGTVIGGLVEEFNLLQHQKSEVKQPLFEAAETIVAAESNKLLEVAFNVSQAVIRHLTLKFVLNVMQ